MAHVKYHIFICSFCVMCTDPPSIETVPASGELEVNLEEEVNMQCVAKGVPAPNISWETKVIDIYDIAYIICARTRQECPNEKERI